MSPIHVAHTFTHVHTYIYGYIYIYISICVYMHYVHGMKSYPPMRTCNVAQASMHVGIPMPMDCYSAGSAEPFLLLADVCVQYLFMKG